MTHIKTQILYLSVISLLIMWCCSKQQKDINTHPWASFKKDSYVDVYSYHKMTMKEKEPSEWDSEIRLSVLDITDSYVYVLSHNKQNGYYDTATLSIPLIDEFNGMRALGHWPHDIFAIGPEKEAGITTKDKNSIPQNITVEKTEENVKMTIGETPYSTTHYRKQWTITFRGKQKHYTLNTWKADGIELPLKWTIEADSGKEYETTTIIELADTVIVEKKKIPCIVTLTNKKTREGSTLMKKRWSSSQVPGFMVKMEAKMESNSFSHEVQEHITKFYKLNDHKGTKNTE